MVPLSKADDVICCSLSVSYALQVTIAGQGFGKRGGGFIRESGHECPPLGNSG